MTAHSERDERFFVGFYDDDDGSTGKGAWYVFDHATNHGEEVLGPFTKEEPALAAANRLNAADA